MAALSSAADVLQTSPALKLVVGIEMENYLEPVTHKLHLVSPQLQLKVLGALLNLIDIADAKGQEGCRHFKDALDTATDVASNLVGKAGLHTRQAAVVSSLSHSPKLGQSRRPSASSSKVADPLELNDICFLEEEQAASTDLLVEHTNAQQKCQQERRASPSHDVPSTWDGSMTTERMTELDKFKARSVGELPTRLSRHSKQRGPRPRRAERAAPIDLKAFAQEICLPSIRPPRHCREKPRPGSMSQEWKPRTAGELREFESESSSSASFQGKPLPLQNRCGAPSLTQQCAYPSPLDALSPGPSTGKMRPKTEGELPLSELLQPEADLESSENEGQLLSNADSEGEDSKQDSLRKRQDFKSKAEANSNLKARQPHRAHCMTPAGYATELPDGTGALGWSKRRASDPKPMPRAARAYPMDLSGWNAQSGASTTDQSLGILRQSSQPSGAPRPRSEGHLRPRTDGDIAMDQGNMKNINFTNPEAELDSSEEDGELSNTDSDDDDDVGLRKQVKSTRMTPAEYSSVSFGAAELHAIEEALYSSQQSEDSDRARPVSRAVPMDFSGLQIRPPAGTFQSELLRPQSRGRLLSFSRRAPCPDNTTRPKTDGELAKCGQASNSDVALDPGDIQVGRLSDKDSS